MMAAPIGNRIGRTNTALRSQTLDACANLRRGEGERSCQGRLIKARIGRGSQPPKDLKLGLGQPESFGPFCHSTRRTATADRRRARGLNVGNFLAVRASGMSKRGITARESAVA
jgi:hypothetical protein